jgi:anthranilate synthase component 2
MILLVDNYDSFTFNLYQYLGELGQEVEVVRNDAMSATAALELKPDRIVISPGPGTPDDAGISLELVRLAAGRVPLLGVCLGHQALGQSFGARVVRASKLMHGKTSMVQHDGLGLFAGIASPLEATRYHSLVVERESLPRELVVTAWTEDGTIMGVRHEKWPLEGVQFHPESILTSSGHEMLANFLKLGGVGRAGGVG